ncbi:MAG: LysR family transcriptional regulator [Polyangiaceae bacterium]|jgi:DNA-binding transcriptional LysR family regulator|nr:LysR family transcriptional regulator [Polyangiaceae bacterium]
MSFAGADLNQLRVLDALLSERSVSRAARRLGVTQAAASNALRRLRETVGDPLLVRAGRRMVLTPRAEALVGPAAEAMRAAAKVLAPEAAFEPARASGTFRLATSDHVDVVLLPRIEQMLAGEAPNVDVHLLPFGRRAEDDLRVGRVDLIIAPAREGPADIVSERLFDDRLVWVMRAGHEAAAGSISAESFALQRHLLVSPRGHAGGPVDVALADRGLKRRIARTMPHFGTALILLSRSDLVSVLPVRLVSAVAPLLGLQWRPLPFALPTVTLAMSSHRRDARDARQAYLRGVTQRAAESLEPLAGG